MSLPKVMCLLPSSIGGGGTSTPALPPTAILSTSAFFPYYGTSAFFEKSNTRIRVQNHECKNTSAKIRVQNHRHKTRNSICWEISWKLYAGKFLGNHKMEISWKLYAGNLLMETMCWEIQVDASSFLNFGTMLWHHTMVSRQWYQGLS